MELTRDQQNYYLTKLSEIRKEGKAYSIEIVSSIGGLGQKYLGPVEPPVIVLSKDSQYFNSRSELMQFVKDLLKTADKAWGKHVQTDASSW